MRDVILEPGEVLIKAVRKHWFVLMLTLLPFFLGAILPVLALTAAAFFVQTMPASYGSLLAIGLNTPYPRLFYGLWLLMLWSTAFNQLTRYYLNEWVITSTRIIAVHQYGFFSREISSLLLIKIQDVDVNVDGLFGTLVQYGQLQVQSAGTAEHFIMDDIPDPNGLRDLIMKEIAALHADGRQAVNSNTSASL